MKAVRYLLLPLIKSFKGMFLTLTLTCLLSIGVISGLGSAINNLETSYSSYLEEYQAPDIALTFDVTSKQNIDTSTLEDIDHSISRISSDAELKTNNGKTLQIRLNSYNAEDHTLYFYHEPTLKEDVPNIYINQALAKHHSLEAGQETELGYYGCYIKANIAAIIDAPETLYITQNEAIWSSNSNYGLAYLESSQLGLAVSNYAQALDTARTTDPAFKERIDNIIITNFGITLDSIEDASPIINEALSGNANELWVYVKENSSLEVAKAKVEALLKEHNVTITSSRYQNELPYDSYLSSAISQLKNASLYLPIFFCIITLLIVALFTHQIILRYTRQIGILSSLGISKQSMLLLFISFSGLFTLLSTLLATLLGAGLSALISNIFLNIYGIPIMSNAFHPLLVLFAFLILLTITLIATLFSCLYIFRLSPLDAIDESRKAKHNPKWVDRIIAKSPSGIALALANIFQHKGRSLASTFALLASTSALMVSSLFLVSKDALVYQTSITRLPFTHQVYFSSKVDDAIYEDLSSKPYIQDIQNAAYTYLELSSTHASTSLETIGLNAEDQSLTYVPSIDGDSRLYCSGKGIILPNEVASLLGVTIGEEIVIHNHKIQISGISKQYFHYQAYISLDTLLEIGVDTVSTFFMNTDNEIALQEHLSSLDTPSILVDSSSLQEDLRYRYNAINILLSLLMGIALILSLSILLMMTFNTLLERRRSISIMRSLGLSIKEVGQSFFYQGTIEYIIALVIGLPISIGVASILLKSMSSTSLSYPLLLGWTPFAVSIGFVVLVLLASLFLSLSSIRRWNLSDNLRARE